MTVTADAQSRLYGAADPAMTYISSGMLNGDTLSGGLATLATTTSNVGVYGIAQGTLANSNYAMTYTGANLSVTAAPLTVTADAQSRLYGAPNPALTYISSGLLNGDTFSGGLATLATTTSDVGTYGITQGTLGATSNYTLSYTSANLTVTATPVPPPPPPPSANPSPSVAPVAGDAPFQAFPSFFAADVAIDVNGNCIVPTNLKTFARLRSAHRCAVLLFTDKTDSMKRSHQSNYLRR